ncbi:transcriptional regulator [Mesorhizobium hungaricum]|jgi:DNA-binding transcriptional regulator YdaS (Cro superfamily)|nr:MULTISPECIES: YdaS family helix-turn-helix protein [Mesorhizobium]MBN9236030.1 helix-turn-helix domain-containing protein [Mesorhizobium sp.]
MSDKRISEIGNNLSGADMSTALIEAAQWADELMEAETKSRREKEYMVRNRLAKEVGCSQQYISLLLREGGQLSAEMSLGFERATNSVISRHDLRPDIFGPSQEERVA